MKYVRVAVIAAAVFGTAAGARAQWGLYGSPEILRLPRVENGAATQPISPVAPGQPAPQPILATSGTYDMRLAAAEPAIPPAPVPPQATPPAPPAQVTPGPSVLDQLLQESGMPGGGPSGYGCAANEAAPCNTCGDDLDCQECFPCPWYVSAAGLILTRNDANRVWTTYETNNNPNQLMNTDDAESDWRGGAEIRLGRSFCCGTWAVEATFWALDDMHGSAGLYSPGGGLSTPLDFSDVMYASDPTGIDPARPVDLFDSADAHMIRRVNEIYNLEINLVRSPMAGCGPLDVDVLAGVRWFRFREHLNFASLNQDGDWWEPSDVGYLDDRIENNLIGGQVGANIAWDLGYRLGLFARPKFGIYNNHIEHRFNAYRGDGELFVPREGSGVVGTYPVESDTDTISFLTEIDVGMDWRFHPQWSAFLGYRLLVATGIGLSDHQFTHYVVDIPELAHIDDNGTLILHGAFAGLKYNF